MSYCPCEESCLDSLECTFFLDLDYYDVKTFSSPSVFTALNQHFDFYLRNEEAKEVILRFVIFNQTVKLDSIMRCETCNISEIQLIEDAFASSKLKLITSNHKFIDQKYRTYLRFLVKAKN